MNDIGMTNGVSDGFFTTFVFLNMIINHLTYLLLKTYFIMFVHYFHQTNVNRIINYT